MTKEEAIYKAKHMRKVRPNICIDAEDFWDTVIAALEQEPCTVTEFADRCMECGKILGDMIKKRNGIAEAQEPCDDAVSREAVFDLCDSKDEEYKVRHFREDVECLPSVQPKQTKSCYKMCDKWQRMGRWKPYDGSWYECSECGAVREAVGFFENYCPNCGAKMASPTGAEGSDKE